MLSFGYEISKNHESLSLKPMCLPRPTVLVFRTALLTAVTIIMYLATTRLDLPVGVGLDDKVNHILAFYILALLMDFSFPERRFDFSKAATLLGYGLLIECVQYFLPYRTFSLLDLAADAMGLLAYMLFLPALKYIPWLRWRWNVPEREDRAE